MGDAVRVARRLRRDQTDAERRFWALLYPWRCSGWHFRRQAPVGVYFADFVCKREKLIIEIDGGGHYGDEGAARDARRTAVLGQAGYRVVRFSNDDVLGNADGVGEVLVGILGEPGVFGGWWG
ncbi:Very-short-patch-repair endonuclease [Devosia psychrophila]|uniref:Very-short-patch-repair endonuclease n=2 Tax=Devosia psychrophila TaxID=728005 RepID=A0A1I1MTI7_9HYPH|nr:Very-short-patch-repair endonuclease [Devosia psychrophila]